MKFHDRIILCAAALFIIIIYPNVQYAEQKEIISINSFEQDVTGDSLPEQITLHGRLLKQNSAFYQDVWIDITSSFKKNWSINLQHGYHPKLQLIDINHDHAIDLFYQIAKNNDNDFFHYQLYSLKKGKVESLPLPEHYHLQGQLADHFKGKLTLNPTEKPMTIDLTAKKENYINEKIYNEAGEIQQKIDIIIKPFSSLTPIIISKSKGYGLKSTQTIKGINEEDVLGTMETIWYFQKDRWLNMKSTFIKE